VTPRLKLLSLGTTILMSAGAFVIGGGLPLAPAEILAFARDAASNVQEAVGNTRLAARRTESLRVIAENVRSQVAASHRLLEIQLRIEQSSEQGVERSQDLARVLRAVESTIGNLQARLRRLTRTSRNAGSGANATADAGDDLDATLQELIGRFDEVVKQSRRLNRKARAYGQLRGAG
jgi:hypothetical protein